MSFIKFNNLKGDIFGGITAGIVALPLALAFGIQAFSGIDAAGAAPLGAYAGLVGATLLGFFASLFGGTHSQISGPTGPMTVIAATLIGGTWASSGGGDFSAVLVSMSLAGLFCGLFQILFGILKIGKYIRYIPYPVLSGFMSGIGVIIILQQLYPMVGQSGHGSMGDLLMGLPNAFAHANITALLLALGTVAIIYLFPLVTKKVPAALTALVVMTVVSLFINMDGVPIIGEIPSGVPMPFFADGDISLSSVDWGLALKSAVIPGLTLAGLGSIDTLLTSVVADNITKTKHNSNRELVGQGIGNAMAGLFCGLPGAGATMRTVVNVKNGGRTQISGMVHALLLLAVMLGLGQYVKYVPLSVLAGILITVGVGIIDFRGFKDLFKIPRADAVVLVLVFFVTVFVDLLTAVGIGMVVACVLFMKRASDLVEGGYSSATMTQADLHRGLPDPGKANFDKSVPWSDEGGITDEMREHIYIQRLNGPIFFGTINKFKEVMMDVPEDAKVVIIRMRLVSFMDQSGLYAMEEALKDIQSRGTLVLMTIIQPQPMYMLRTLGVIPSVIPEWHTFKTFEDCTVFLHQYFAKEKKTQEEV